MASEGVAADGRIVRIVDAELKKWRPFVFLGISWGFFSHGGSPKSPWVKLYQHDLLVDDAGEPH
jgi:hypothetical protein